MNNKELLTEGECIIRVALAAPAAAFGSQAEKQPCLRPDFPTCVGCVFKRIYDSSVQAPITPDIHPAFIFFS